MKTNKPDKLLFEKLKEKDREIGMLLDYIERLESTLECSERICITQSRLIDIKDKLIRLYEPHFPSSDT